VVTAIFIDSQGSIITNREEYLATSSTTKPHSTTLKLDIKEHLFVAICRTAIIYTRVDTQTAISKEHHLGEILTILTINNIRLERLHRLTTADNWDF
jgi:hypothetical protein